MHGCCKLLGLFKNKNNFFSFLSPISAQAKRFYNRLNPEDVFIYSRFVMIIKKRLKWPNAHLHRNTHMHTY